MNKILAGICIYTRQQQQRVAPHTITHTHTLSLYLSRSIYLTIDTQPSRLTFWQPTNLDVCVCKLENWTEEQERERITTSLICGASRLFRIISSEKWPCHALSPCNIAFYAIISAVIEIKLYRVANFSFHVKKDVLFTNEIFELSNSLQCNGPLIFIIASNSHYKIWFTATDPTY